MIIPCFQEKQGIQPPAWQFWPPEILFLISGQGWSEARCEETYACTLL